MAQVQKSFFSTKELPPNQRLPAWRESISTLFDITPTQHSTAEVFNANLTSYLLNDQIMLSLCETTAQRFERGPLRNARDGLDYYLIQTHLSGSQDVRRAGKDSNSSLGDLMVIDLADLHTAITSDFSNLTLVIPRHLLAPHLLHPDSQEGRVLNADHGLTTLAVNHLRTLAGIIDTLTPEEAVTTIRPTLLLLASALNGNISSVDGGATGAAISLLTWAKTEIEKQLHQDMSVDSLCARLKLSRASLYRLFEPFGGVRSYIQERRLKRCAEDLVSPQLTKRPIYEIAFNWGFGSEAHFSRAFKQRFGVSPSEARHFHSQIKLNNPTIATQHVGDRYYEQWLSETLKS